VEKLKNKEVVKKFEHLIQNKLAENAATHREYDGVENK